MRCGTGQKLAFILQQTQSIPDCLSVATMCYFLSTSFQRLLKFLRPHYRLVINADIINTLPTYGHPKCCSSVSASVSQLGLLNVSYVTSNLFHLCPSARCGGTVGAILTCPLEVVKTRLQSSSITLYMSGVQLSTVNGASVARVAPPGPLHFLKWVFNNFWQLSSLFSSRMGSVKV